MTISDTHTLSWIDPEGDVIPMEHFGKDHWSTFAYIETRCVDYHGVLDHDHMRCHAGRHPLFVYAGRRAAATGASADGAKYATRIKVLDVASGEYVREEIFDHDDYDCVLDLMAAGLIEVSMPEVNANGMFIDAYGRLIRDEEGYPMHESFVSGLVESYLQRYAKFSLTSQGSEVAGSLRAHKANGGNFHQFVA